MTPRPPLTIEALEGIPEVSAGDDLLAVIGAAAGGRLRDGDIVVVTSKIVSKAEGRAVDASEYSAALAEETTRVVATRGSTRIVENRLGIVGAAAGVDVSNAADGTVLLLPLDPDASARELARGLRRAGARVGVIITDTLGRPWREGQTDIAIGAAGVLVFDDLRGQVDSAGRELHVTRPCIADEVAAAADLVKGKTRGLPVAVVRGMAHAVGSLDLPGARAIVRSSERDMFREGHEQAYARGLSDGRHSSADRHATW